MDEAKEEYMRGMKINYDYLDTLDVKSYVEKCCADVSQIMYHMEKELDDSPDLPPELDGCIFNYINTEEFANYLSNRYGYKISVRITYQYFVNE